MLPPIDRACGRQLNHDPRAAPEGALDDHAAAVQVDECRGEGKAEPRTFVSPGEAVIDLDEGLEYLRDIVRRHADAGIGDRYHAAAIRSMLQRELDLAVHRRELDRVREQI